MKFNNHDQDFITEVVASFCIIGALWMKLVINIANCISWILGSRRRFEIAFDVKVISGDKED